MNGEKDGCVAAIVAMQLFFFVMGKTRGRLVDGVKWNTVRRKANLRQNH